MKRLAILIAVVSVAVSASTLAPVKVAFASIVTVSATPYFSPDTGVNVITANDSTSNLYAGFYFTWYQPYRLDSLSMDVCGSSVLSGLAFYRDKTGTYGDFESRSSVPYMSYSSSTWSGSIASCASGNKTTVTWVLDEAFDVEVGQRIYVAFVSTSTANTNHPEFNGSGFSVPYGVGNYENGYLKMCYSFGCGGVGEWTTEATTTYAYQPSFQIGGALSQLATPSSLEACNLWEVSTFDLGGCFGGIFAWAFVPATSLTERTSDIASSTRNASPFGYIYALSDKVDEYAAYSTSSLAISVELSGVMNFLGASYSSTSITVLSGSGLRSTLGSSMWLFVQTIFSGAFWLAFLLYVYRRAIHLL